jgi:hypothetical protein
VPMADSENCSVRHNAKWRRYHTSLTRCQKGMLVPICHSRADVISANGVDWTLDSVQVTSWCGSAIWRLLTWSASLLMAPMWIRKRWTNGLRHISRHSLVTVTLPRYRFRVYFNGERIFMNRDRMMTAGHQRSQWRCMDTQRPCELLEYGARGVPSVDY